MEVWRDYRKEIDSNIDLQKSVQASNEKLNLLYKRLLEVFPNYNGKYEIKKFDKALLDEEVSSPPKYSIAECEELISEFNDAMKMDDNFKAIDEMDFSSHELDYIFNNIRKHKENEKLARNIGGDNNIVFNKTKIRKLINNKNSIIRVAIDGPSGSGKSTVAKTLAEKYNLTYINTGLVYRAIAMNAIDKGVNLRVEEDVVDTLQDLDIELLRNEVVKINGLNVSKQLRTDEASQGASVISIYKEVREWALLLQQKYTKENKVIMDGRDTTFKVMPEANVKIFLDTSAEVRANRRLKQNKDLGFEASYEKILNEIELRDDRDKNRKIDPLHKTKDATEIDASNLSIDEVVEKISKLIEVLL